MCACLTRLYQNIVWFLLKTFLDTHTHTCTTCSMVEVLNFSFFTLFLHHLHSLIIMVFFRAKFHLISCRLKLKYKRVKLNPYYACHKVWNMINHSRLFWLFRCQRLSAYKVWEIKKKWERERVRWWPIICKSLHIILKIKCDTTVKGTDIVRQEVKRKQREKKKEWNYSSVCVLYVLLGNWSAYKYDYQVVFTEPQHSNELWTISLNSNCVSGSTFNPIPFIYIFVGCLLPYEHCFIPMILHCIVALSSPLFSARGFCGC